MSEPIPATTEKPMVAAVPEIAEDPLRAAKEVEFYAASVNAWYATALEHDKSLFVLAGGGIGVMVTLLTTVGFESYWVFLPFLVAILCFLTCLAYLLRIFDGNRSYLEALVSRTHQDKDFKLKHWDKIAGNSFIIGVAFSIAVAMIVATLRIQAKQKELEQMTSKDQAPPVVLQPLGKSFQGAANMAPTPASAPASAGQVPAPAASAAVQPASGAASQQPVVPAPEANR